MKLYVGITDREWFRFLAARQPDEVNFWRPSGQGFGAVRTGEPFLFKLHAPDNFIAGGGFFVSYTRLPLSLLWLAYGEANGTPDRATLEARITSYRQGRGDAGEPDPVVGNIVLTEPFFWPREAWIPVPQDWAPNTQQGKAYDTQGSVGARLWAEVQDRLRADPRYGAIAPAVPRFPAREDPVERVRAFAMRRLHQGSFRTLVTDAYGRQCAVTHEHTLPVLEAAHIQPVAESGSHSLTNGILLRADVHILFDRGYVTVDPDYRFLVSDRLEADFHNGRDYYAHRGERITLPKHQEDWPSPDRLAYHRSQVFIA